MLLIFENVLFFMLSHPIKTHPRPTSRVGGNGQMGISSRVLGWGLFGLVKWIVKASGVESTKIAGRSG
jgi:hypothetical protein